MMCDEIFAYHDGKKVNLQILPQLCRLTDLYILNLETLLQKSNAIMLSSTDINSNAVIDKYAVL
jgi:hypothetical protein